ncbi:hypothetical protein [Cetobacterium sp.]|uniref:hypothetical protein n=1 Tax=Cetobacterium sp. TaxID=2071632 RepID=UPI002FCA7A76
MKDIAVEYNSMDFATKGMIEIIVSGRDIEELFQELKQRGYEPTMNSDYEFKCKVDRVILDELGERF